MTAQEWSVQEVRTLETIKPRERIEDIIPDCHMPLAFTGSLWQAAQL